MDSMMMPFAPAPPVQDLGVDMLTPEMVMELLGGARERFEPKMRPGWKRPPKPTAERISAAAKAQEQINRARIDRQMDVVARLRFAKSGIFQQDKRAAELGDLDGWQSSALVDDWNLVSSALSLNPISYVKQTIDRSMREEGQAVEDFCSFVRSETEARWAERGDMILPMAEAKVLTAYGMIVSRNLVDLEDDECPVDSTLIDPATVFVVRAGRKGISHVFHRYTTTLAEAIGDWGEPSPAGFKKLKNDRGERDLTDKMVVTVTDYWDTAWRSVSIEGGVELLPITEHEYGGRVPWVVQLATGGEPLFTDTGLAAKPRDDRGYRSGPTDDFGLEHKGLGTLDAQRVRHDQTEALMTLVLDAYRRGINPALVLKRGLNFAADELPEVDRRPGGMTELTEGEALDALPTGTPPGETQLLFNSLNQDRMSGSSPMSAFGSLDGMSNVSGVARSGAAEQGQDKIAPLVKTLESYHAQNATMWLRQFRNQGHLVRFKDGGERPFLVPVARPRANQKVLQAVTPELIDAVGDRVAVKMARVRNQDLMGLVAAGSQAIQAGVLTKRRLAEMIGETDYDRMADEWQEERVLDMAMSLPEFIKTVVAPQYIARKAQETDDPLEREMLMIAMEKWDVLIAQPQAAQLAPPPAPMGGPPGMTPPASNGSPPTSAGVSYAQLGQGPGSQTGVQGGPPGPTGPNGPQASSPFGP